MRQQVTSLESAEAAAESLTGLLTGHAEWLYLSRMDAKQARFAAQNARSGSIIPD